MENMENNATPSTPLTPHFFSNEFEHGMSFLLPDGQRQEIVLVHLPGSEPMMKAAIFPLGEDANGEPSTAGPWATLEEIRLRYEYFAWLKAEGQLDKK